MASGMSWPASALMLSVVITGALAVLCGQPPNSQDYTVSPFIEEVSEPIGSCSSSSCHHVHLVIDTKSSLPQPDSNSGHPLSYSCQISVSLPTTTPQSVSSTFSSGLSSELIESGSTSPSDKVHTRLKAGLNSDLPQTTSSLSVSLRTHDIRKARQLEPKECRRRQIKNEDRPRRQQEPLPAVSCGASDTKDGRRRSLNQPQPATSSRPSYAADTVSSRNRAVVPATSGKSSSRNGLVPKPTCRSRQSTELALMSSCSIISKGALRSSEVLHLKPHSCPTPADDRRPRLCSDWRSSQPASSERVRAARARTNPSSGSSSVEENRHPNPLRQRPQGHQRRTWHRPGPSCKMQIHNSIAEAISWRSANSERFQEVTRPRPHGHQRRTWHRPGPLCKMRVLHSIADGTYSRGSNNERSEDVTRRRRRLIHQSSDTDHLRIHADPSLADIDIENVHVQQILARIQRLRQQLWRQILATDRFLVRADLSSSCNPEESLQAEQILGRNRNLLEDDGLHGDCT